MTDKPAAFIAEYLRAISQCATLQQLQVLAAPTGLKCRDYFPGEQEALLRRERELRGRK